MTKNPDDEKESETPNSHRKTGETPSGTGGMAKATITEESNTKVGEAPTVTEGAPNAKAGEEPRRDGPHKE